MEQTVPHKKSKDLIIEFDNLIDTARIKALQNKDAWAWFNSLPSKNVGADILKDDCSFQVSIGLRLGFQLCREFKCNCYEFVDRKGLHTLFCSKATSQYFFRHAEVNNAIKKAIVPKY